MACAAGRAALRVIAEEGMQRNALEVGTLFGRALERAATHPRVGQVRGRGLMRGIEFVRDRATRETFPWRERRHLRIHRHALGRGVLLRPLGNVIYFMPPYVVTPEEIELMVTVGREGLDLAVAG